MAFNQFLQSGAANMVFLADAAPTTTVTNTEWTLSSTTATAQIGERSVMIFQVTRSVGTFAAGNDADTPPFNGTAWRSALLTRTIPAGDWDLRMRLRSSGAQGAPSVRGRWRVFKGTDTTDGAGATELTSGTILGSETGQTAAGSNGDTIATWAAPDITLDNEFLIVSFALEARANNGTTNSGNRIYSLQIGGASSISTPDAAAIEFVGGVLI